MRKPPVFVAVALCLVLPAAEAGAILETVGRDLPGGKESGATTIYVEGGQLRVEHREGAAGQPQGGMIFKNDTMYALDHEKKNYTVIDRAQAKKMASQVSEAMQQMENELAKIPPEQRAMVEEMMRGSAGGAAAPKRGPAEYKKTTRTETAGGHSCRIWEGTVQGRKVTEYCVVPFGSIAGGQEVLAALKNMMSLMQEMFSALSASPFEGATMGTEWEGVNAIDGYPALVRRFEDGKAVSEDVLKSARSASVPATQFEVPAGYKQESLERRGE
jgi:hypothetical protein